MPLRPLNKIAADILKEWGPSPPTGYRLFAMPYVEAMLELRQIHDYYGLDDAEDIILRFLTNVALWRGETARSIKAELNAHLKAKQIL